MTTTRYELRDATGALIAIHERIDDGADKRLLWRGPDGRLGLGEMPLADVPLYGAHLLGDWAPSRAIVITEGEKAAQALLDAGLPALGTCTGASATPSRTVLGELTGRHVVLWPDADDVGTGHMRRIAAILNDVAASVRWLSWSDAPTHGDAFDYLQGTKGASAHTVDEARALLDAAGDVPDGDAFEHRGLGYHGKYGRVDLSLDRLAWSRGELHGELVVRLDDAHVVQTRFNASQDAARSGMAKRMRDKFPHDKIEWGTTFEAFCVRVLAEERTGEPFRVVGRNPRRPATPYLMYPMLPEHKPTILFGEGASGKSTLASAVVVSVTTGVPVLDGWMVTRPTRALVLDWEADEYEWNDRVALIAKGAGLDAPEIDYRYCGARGLVDQVEDVARHIVARGIGLVIVDSVGMASPANSMGGDANESAIRLFQALRHLRVTSLLIDHVSKAAADQEGGALRPYGSIFKVNLARSVFELKRGDASDPLHGHAALYHRKCNGGPIVPPVGVCYEYADDYWRLDREAIDDDDLTAALPLDRQIEGVLREHGRLTPKEIADALGLPGNKVRAILSRFDGKKFTHLDDGDWGLCYVAA
jgi:hypothetical protein